MMLVAVEPLLCPRDTVVEQLHAAFGVCAKHGVLRFSVPELAIHPDHGGHDIHAYLSAEPAKCGESARIAVQWTTHGCSLAPAFLGELSIQQGASPARCMMELRGWYDVPAKIDAARVVMVHRLAGAAALCFLKAVRERIEPRPKSPALGTILPPALAVPV